MQNHRFCKTCYASFICERWFWAIFFLAKSARLELFGPFCPFLDRFWTGLRPGFAAQRRFLPFRRLQNVPFLARFFGQKRGFWRKFWGGVVNQVPFFLECCFVIRAGGASGPAKLGTLLRGHYPLRGVGPALAFSAKFGYVAVSWANWMPY